MTQKVAGVVNISRLVWMWCAARQDIWADAEHFLPHAIDGGASGRIENSNYETIGTWQVIGCQLTLYRGQPDHMQKTRPQS